MKDELKGTETQEKGTEQVQSTEPKAESTERTFKTEADFQRAVSKANEATTRQHDLRKAEAEKYKTEAGQYKTGLESLQMQYDELVTKQFADDPEARQAYIDKRAIAKEKAAVAKEKTEAVELVYQASMKEWRVGMGLKAQELDRRFPELKLDLKQLIDSCATEPEMELEVLNLKLEAGTKQEEPSKIESGLSYRGKGEVPETAKGKIQAGWTKLHPVK